jgi:type II secretory pathway pseudopilin PulG
MGRQRRVHGEQGETLLELIVAITILGVCVVAIGSGIAMSVKISAIHRNQATASAFLHNYAETVQGAYATCSGGSSLPNYAAGLAAPSNFDPPTASVKVWDATTASFVASATNTCPATDPGLQQVSLTLASTDGFVSESLVVVVRKT